MLRINRDIAMLLALLGATACGGIDAGGTRGTSGDNGSSTASSDGGTPGADDGADATTDSRPVIADVTPLHAADTNATAGGVPQPGPNDRSTASNSFCCELNGSAWSCPGEVALGRCADSESSDPSGCAPRGTLCDGVTPSASAPRPPSSAAVTAAQSNADPAAAPSSAATPAPTPAPPPPAPVCGSGTGGESAPCSDCSQCAPGYECTIDPGLAGFCSRKTGLQACTSSSDCTDPATHCCTLVDDTTACIPIGQGTQCN